MTELSGFKVEDIDGTEFINDTHLGKGLISYNPKFSKVLVIWPDGSGNYRGCEEAQSNFDSGTWKVFR